MKNKILLPALLVATVSVTANASTTTFFGEDLGSGENTALASTPNADAAQANFLTGLVNPGVENFEGIANGTSNPAINFVGAGVTATITGGTVQSTANGTTNGVGRYGISGDPDANGSDSFLETSSALVLTFNNPVAAFGFYGIDIGDFNGQVTLSTAGGLNQFFNVGNTLNGAGGSVLFWGLISNTDLFTSITFGNTNAGTDFFGFDDFTVASLEQVSNVPVPASIFLMMSSLLGLPFLRKRKA